LGISPLESHFFEDDTGLAPGKKFLKSRLGNDTAPVTEKNKLKKKKKKKGIKIARKPEASIIQLWIFCKTRTKTKRVRRPGSIAVEGKCPTTTSSVSESRTDSFSNTEANFSVFESSTIFMMVQVYCM
jgi:hypothetical protein